MELCMKETIYKERNRDKETFNGLMAQSTLANSSITILKESESTDGQMAEGTMGNGATTRCMVRVFSHGLTGGNTKENTQKTRNKEWECSSGRMEDSMQDSGLTASSMVEEHLLLSMASREMVNGTMERD